MALNPAHVLETAFLLLVAFLIGATVGALAKMVVLRLRVPKAAAAVASPVVAEAVDGQPALVAAPVIEPTARPAQPEAPAAVPTPDFSEVAREVAAAKVEAAPMPEARKAAKLSVVDTSRAGPGMAPAREAGKTTSGKQVQSPKVTEEATASATTTGPSADVIPFPAERVAPVSEAAAAPVAKAIEAKADEIAPVPEAAAASPEPTGVVEEVPEPAAADYAETAEPAPAASAEPAAGADAVVDQPVASETIAPVVAEEPISSDKAAAPEDETAAMRAIEGHWTPRRAPGRRATKVPAPEGISVEEGVAAEALAVVETPAEAPGKPAGIAAPRGGMKDNLTNVIGILPVIETSLNSMGVFHYDQVGQFSDENVSWLEAHLGIDGRIDREHWREQARELAAISDKARKVAGQP